MIANGQHTLRVVATDTVGNVLTATRQFYLNTRTCNVLIGTRMYRASNDHAVLIGPSSIRQGEPIVVEGICSVWSPVQQMEFYLDGVLQSTDTSAPTYTWTLNTSGLAVGNHTIGITGRLSPSGVSNHSIPIEILPPSPDGPPRARGGPPPPGPRRPAPPPRPPPFRRAGESAPATAPSPTRS